MKYNCLNILKMTEVKNMRFSLTRHITFPTESVQCILLNFHL